MLQTPEVDSVFKLKDKNTHPSHVIYKSECIRGQTYIRELIAQTFLSHGRQPEVDISPVRRVLLSLR